MRGFIRNNRDPADPTVPVIYPDVGNNAGRGIDMVVDQTGKGCHLRVQQRDRSRPADSSDLFSDGLRGGARNAGTGEADLTLTGKLINCRYLCDAVIGKPVVTVHEYVHWSGRNPLYKAESVGFRQAIRGTVALHAEAVLSSALPATMSWFPSGEVRGGPELPAL
jgi:hypothetical protein